MIRTGRDTYLHFVNFHDRDAPTVRRGRVYSDSVFVYGGAEYGLGIGTNEEFSTLPVSDAAEWRSAPRRFLSGLDEGQRVLIRFRGSGSRGVLRAGTAIVWVMRLSSNGPGG